MVNIIKKLRKKRIKCYLTTNQEKYRTQYMKITYKEIQKEEIAKVKEIDRREICEQSCEMQDGIIVVLNKEFKHLGFSSEKFDQIIKELEMLYDNGGTVIGAFDDYTLVGISALENKFRGKNLDTLKLDVLWISQSYRKLGIGTKLVGMIKEKAKLKGAKKLYISSCESKNTVDFYLKIGSVLASEIDRELFELEPHDIHLELSV